VTDATDLLARYLRQQADLGMESLVLPEGLRVGRPAVAAGAAGPPRPAARERAPAAQRPVKPRSGTGPPDTWQADAPPIPGPGIIVPAADENLFRDDPLATATLDDVVKLVASCTRCPLHATRTNAVPGEGPADARLVVVGEGPGANEDELGRPFVGRAGKLLDDILAAIGCPRETVYIANVVKSRPPNNRKPQGDEIEACLPFLYRQLEIIRPRVILAMGATAAESLLAARGSLASLRNKVHVFRGIPLIVTYHPAALLRNPHWKRPTWDDVRIARQLLDR